MALITSNATVLYSAGDFERYVLYRVANVDTADTIDVSAKFSEVKVAAFLVAGTPTGVGVVTISGTTLTLTLSGVADDAILLLVVGQAAV